MDCRQELDKTRKLRILYVYQLIINQFGNFKMRGGRENCKDAFRRNRKTLALLLMV